MTTVTLTVHVSQGLKMAYCMYGCTMEGVMDLCNGAVSNLTFIAH